MQTTVWALFFYPISWREGLRVAKRAASPPFARTTCSPWDIGPLVRLFIRIDALVADRELLFDLSALSTAFVAAIRQYAASFIMIRPAVYFSARDFEGVDTLI